MKLRLFFNVVLLVFSSILVNSCASEAKDKKSKIEVAYPSEVEEKIIDSVMVGIHKLRLNSQERRDALDVAIAKFPDIANFYQQRAMPLYKQNKDELGLPFLEKAAALNPEKYLDYMGFMKCIFSKNYRGAISDFEKVQELSGDGYVMDHTYYFYIGISYLQLNEFEKAKIYLDKSIAQTEGENGREWVHFLDLWYLGIANYELGDCENAIVAYDEALSKYPSFGDVKYYKAICLFKMKKYEASQALFKEAKDDILNDNTINEDNVIYEEYPYQVRKTWFQ
ncbi:tetratricopeptide repeat protein [Ulvibacter antarcticus]|uniref:Tetratricopeptide repeat protein n=1 Tax=Ulvibacter antarcticus TaxID=442714 RepID=A0A3L9Y8K5_9FLAO|nr:tetratricopeptide repeat protein [Ulvibacter antarcticus]RMA57026.1 tetratricopeptide repeat protein [Ulvibacter antarcticus]